MRSLSLSCSAIILLCLIAIMAGCSNDKATEPTPHETNPIQLIDIAAIVEAVAPPEYVAPSGAPSVMDSAWVYGEFPLLEPVFGSHEPQALYSNINDFKLSHEIVTSTLRADENGDIIPGTYVDSHLVDFGDQMIMMHFTATVTALGTPTSVPTMSQAVIGSTVDVDYLVSVSITEMPGGVVKIGMMLNDTIQTLFQWEEGMDTGNEGSKLVYASLDPRDSSFTFRGLGYCQHPVSAEWPNGERFCYAYNITAEANADFSYRMSYTSVCDQWSGRYSFLGGGNKDTEFAMKYRSFSPANSTVCDPIWMKEQVFGPNYSEGTGLISSYAEYLDDALMFPYEAVPEIMIPNPWAEH